MVQNLPASAEDARELGSISGLGRPPGEGNGNPLQYSFFFFFYPICFGGFPAISDGKESACNAADLGLIPGSGRSPEKANGNPLQYSCLENP